MVVIKNVSFLDVDLLIIRIIELKVIYELFFYSFI